MHPMAIVLWLALQQVEAVHVDQARGFSIAIPQGWRVSGTGDDVTALRMTSADGRLSFALRVQLPMREINEGRMQREDFAAQIRAQNVRKFPDYAAARVETGMSGEHPTLLMVGAWTEDDRPMRGVQVLFFTKAHLYVLTWIGAADDVSLCEKALVEMGRTFAILKK
ncbi:MAG: hypothetical protein HYY16_06320 [Planctomycetes bacterium]|nr:hypothetical protein [Planctomycetota bacterium]